MNEIPAWVSPEVIEHARAIREYLQAKERAARAADGNAKPESDLIHQAADMGG